MRLAKVIWRRRQRRRVHCAAGPRPATNLIFFLQVYTFSNSCQRNLMNSFIILVFDLSIAHDRFGSTSHVQQNGALMHPQDLDGPMRVAALFGKLNVSSRFPHGTRGLLTKHCQPKILSSYIQGVKSFDDDHDSCTSIYKSREGDLFRPPPAAASRVCRVSRFKGPVLDEKFLQRQAHDQRWKPVRSKVASQIPTALHTAHLALPRATYHPATATFTTRPAHTTIGWKQETSCCQQTAPAQPRCSKNVTAHPHRPGALAAHARSPPAAGIHRVAGADSAPHSEQNFCSWSLSSSCTK